MTDAELLAALGPAPTADGWTDENLLALIAQETGKASIPGASPTES